MSELKLDILRKLDFGLSVTYKIVGVEKKIFNTTIKELADDGYVKYTSEVHELFKDDVKNVKITEKGKDFILNCNN